MSTLVDADEVDASSVGTIDLGFRLGEVLDRVEIQGDLFADALTRMR